ncbi:MAG: hypothetical protein M0C28_11115 [Candidatus Moduliflexus flocculans]|nr:hypothetical protein [Candidatus Moduliflexus flocculans]
MSRHGADPALPRDPAGDAAVPPRPGTVHRPQHPAGRADTAVWLASSADALQTSPASCSSGARRSRAGSGASRPRRSSGRLASSRPVELRRRSRSDHG